MRKLPLSLALLLPLICDPAFIHDRPVPPLTQTGELVVLTRNTPTTRYVDSEGRYAGLEFDLVEQFAHELGVRVRYLDRQPLYQIAPELERSRVGPTTNLRQDLDLDSMDFLSFTLRLGELLHIELREADYPQMSTLPDCVALLERKLAARPTPAVR